MPVTELCMHLCLHTVILFLLAPVEPFELIFAVFVQHFFRFHRHWNSLILQTGKLLFFIIIASEDVTHTLNRFFLMIHPVWSQSSHMKLDISIQGLLHGFSTPGMPSRIQEGLSRKIHDIGFIFMRQDPESQHRLQALILIP